MLRNILIYLIIFLVVISFLLELQITGSGSGLGSGSCKFIKQKKETTEYFTETILNERNFEFDKSSIIMSSNTNLSKDECFNKVNKKDINGASYDLKKNICTLYFFAKKGLQNPNVESKI